jgi:hypothetical protein
MLVLRKDNKSGKHADYLILQCKGLSPQSPEYLTEPFNFSDSSIQKTGSP